MIPFRRNVNLTMEKDIYKKLGNQPNIKKAWNLVRCAVGEEIFKRDFVPVPYIESALYYNQLFVFRKKREMCPCIKLWPPRYKIINNMDNLLNIETSTWIPHFDFSPWTPIDSSHIYGDFNMRFESSEDESKEKSIEISIRQSHIRSPAIPAPGSTNLTLRSSRNFTVYIITSVVLANYVKICVTIDAQQSAFLNGEVIPIGFKYKKYKVLANGQLHSELDTTLKLTDKQATWLPPSEPSVLRIPLWDPMGRRHDGSRPSRNILTLSTIPSQSNQSVEQIIGPFVNVERQVAVRRNPHLRIGRERNNNIQ